MKTKVVTITCPTCGNEIYSRCRHDYHTCGCPSDTMIDGGFDYVRYGGSSANMDSIGKSVRHRFVFASRLELYDDWNHRKDRFGFIKAKRGNK